MIPPSDLSDDELMRKLDRYGIRPSESRTNPSFIKLTRHSSLDFLVIKKQSRYPMREVRKILRAFRLNEEVFFLSPP